MWLWRRLRGEGPGRAWVGARNVGLEGLSLSSKPFDHTDAVSLQLGCLVQLCYQPLPHSRGVVASNPGTAGCGDKVRLRLMRSHWSGRGRGWARIKVWSVLPQLSHGDNIQIVIVHGVKVHVLEHGVSMLN